MAKRRSQDLQIDFWPGFTDAILSVTLVLVFIICIFVVTQASLFTALSSREAALADLSHQLDVLEKTLLFSNSEKIELQRKFDENALQLASSLGELDTAKLELDKAQKDLEVKAQELDKGASDLEASRAALAEAQKRKDAAEATIEKQKTEAEAGAARIRELAKKIEEYLAQVETLSLQLSETKKRIGSRDASLLGLNESVKRLSERISLLSAQLGEAKKERDTKALELSKLLDEIEKRESFKKYKSDFLAQLADVFADMESVKVVGDRFVFQSEVLFPSGRADLTPEGAVKLSKFVMAYKAMEVKIPKDVGFNIQIQGHTDTDPIVRANFASNWELSTSRATSVVRFLVGAGIPANRLSAAGFSQYYPAAPGATDAAKRQNRRIEIFFTRR